MTERTITVEREVIEQASLAVRETAKALIILEETLKQPYPDDPRWSPWTRFIDRNEYSPWSLLAKADTALKAALSSDHQGGRGHRVVIEFDGESIYGSLLHPESGCQPSIDPETEEQLDDECWIQGWFDEYNAELLHGKVEIAVQEEWDGDSARLFVVSPTGDPQKVGPPTPAQPPAPRGLSAEDRKELRPCIPKEQAEARLREVEAERDAAIEEGDRLKAAHRQAEQRLRSLLTDLQGEAERIIDSGRWETPAMATAGRLEGLIRKYAALSSTEQADSQDQEAQ